MNLDNLEPGLSHLSRKKSAILKLPQKVSDEEAAKHEAHREQGSVGVRRLDNVHGCG